MACNRPQAAVLLNADSRGSICVDRLYPCRNGGPVADAHGAFQLGQLKLLMPYQGSQKVRYNLGA